MHEVIKIGAIPLSYRLNRPLVSPSVAGFNLTKRCNSRCQMCHFWKRSVNPDSELTSEEIFQTLRELRQLGVQFVSYAAEGEIFTRKDILDIFRMTEKLGLDFAINTNGLSIPDEFIKDIPWLRPYSIILGVDTADPENYAQIRGIPDGLGRVLTSIQKLKSAGYHTISIGAVVLDNNLDQLLGLAELARREKLSAVRFTAFSPRGFGVKWNGEALERYTSQTYLKKLRVVIDQLIQHKRKYGIIRNSRYYLKEIPKFYESGFRRFPYPCMAGYYNVQIMANGDVLICSVTSYKGPSAVIGNVKKDSLVDLWKSQKAAHERLKVKRRLCPVCWLSCYAENNMRFALNKMIPTNYEAFKKASQYNF